MAQNSVCTVSLEGKSMFKICKYKCTKFAYCIFLNSTLVLMKNMTLKEKKILYLDVLIPSSLCLKCSL